MYPFIKSNKNKLLIIVTAIIIYIPSIYIPFISDEIFYIQKNIARSFQDNLKISLQMEPGNFYYRPLPNLISSFIFNLFDYHYTYYRIFNISLHTLNGILIYTFALLLFKGKNNRELISLFSSLFFIVFPLHDFAVIWYTDLFDKIMLIFFLLGLIFHIKSSFKFNFLSALFFSLSLLSKEMAITFPIIIILLNLFFVNNDLSFKYKIFDAKNYFIIPIVFIVFRFFILDNNVFIEQGIHSTTNLLLTIKNFIFFIGMLIFPFFLRSVETIILANKEIVIILSVAFSAFFIFFLIKNRKKDLILFFLILFIIITIAPASRLLMRWYLYLPSIGFTIFLSYFIFSFNYKKIITPTIISLILFCVYSFALINKEAVWVKNSNLATDSLNEIILINKEAIMNSERIDFLTIPAKIEDIPIFHLNFNSLFQYHINKYEIKNNPEFYIHSKSYINNFFDTIQIKDKNSEYFLSQKRDNYFILFDNEKNTNLDKYFFESGKAKSLLIKKPEKSDVIFTFSNGRFIKLKGKY